MAHLCASAFVVNKDRTKVLSTYHNIYDSWTWTGGHVDGDDDALFVAKKELEEETSLHNFRALLNEPISIESLPVLAHFKRGKFIPAHIHLNVTYLFEADENEILKIKPDENKGVKWLSFNELIRLSKEEYMIPVYKKIIEKIKLYNYIKPIIFLFENIFISLWERNILNLKISSNRKRKSGLLFL